MSHDVELFLVSASAGVSSVAAAVDALEEQTSICPQEIKPGPFRQGSVCQCTLYSRP